MTIEGVLNPTKALRSLPKTMVILERLLTGMTQQQAQALRDGEDGWNVLFVVCHLRDFEAIFTQRVQLILDSTNPTFERVSNDDLARDHNYGAQDLRQVLADYHQRREAFIELLEALDDEQWLRPGIHPVYGPGTVLDMAINAGLHDVDHIEQIMGCVSNRR